jgi:hypothetical protein
MRGQVKGEANTSGHITKGDVLDGSRIGALRSISAEGQSDTARCQFLPLAQRRSTKPHHVGFGSQAHQPRPKSAMGKSESAERSFNRIEAGQAHHIGCWQEENRGGAAGEVGKGQGGAEEVGVEATEPAAKMRRAFSSASRNLSRENWNSQLWF